MTALYSRWLTLGVCLAACLLSGRRTAEAQFGPDLSGAGPINRSMGGTAVAAPIDATGSLYWNPATSSHIGNSLEFGLELLAPDSSLASRVPANALGPGLPPVPMSGSSDSDCGVFPLPSAALLYTPQDSNFTYGLGVFPVAGFGVNYAPSATNPILLPQPPVGFGLGGVFSELQVMQIAPTITAQVTERLSIGIGPTVNLALARLDPMFFGSPDDANGDGFPTYPTGGDHTRMHWGAGFQVGLFYRTDGNWDFGASLKSKQWFEKLEFGTVNELGIRRDDSVDFELPLVASAGAAYTGFDRWLLAADVHYFDFDSAAAFRQKGFDPTGAVRGVGFESIFAINAGAQYTLSERTSLRLGYSFNENPIADNLSSFNVASPTIVMHALYCGASYRLTDALTLSAAYAHGFENSISGPFVTPAGAIPGSSVRNTISVDTFMIGAGMRL